MGDLSFHAYLRFRRSASRYVRLAHLYSAVGIALLRSCYGQILGPRGHLPKFAYSLWRRLDAWVHLDPHLIWQAPRATWSAAMLLGLYRMTAPSFSSDNSYGKQPTTSSLCRRARTAEAQLLQRLCERQEACLCFRIIRRRAREHADAPRPLALLRPRRNRPCRRRAAEQGYHSRRLTSSMGSPSEPAVPAYRTLRLPRKLWQVLGPGPELF
jgi:hypothetical protein